MRRALVALIVVGSTACGDAEGPPQLPPGPDVNAIPAGKGWGCFRDSVADMSLCYRPAECETFRRRIRDEYDRRGLSYSISPCTERPGAACLTMKPATQPAVGSLCFEFVSECEELRTYYASNTTDYSQVSGRCGTYP